MKTYSMNYLADAFEVDRATAVRVCRDAMPDLEAKPDRPTFKIATFARALELHHLKNASNNDGSAEGAASNTAPLIAARTRIAVANAERIELTNAIARGEYASIETMRDLLTPAFLTIREVALGLPGMIADALTLCCAEDRGKIVEIVTEKVRENLENLATAEVYFGAASLASKAND